MIKFFGKLWLVSILTPFLRGYRFQILIPLSESLGIVSIVVLLRHFRSYLPFVLVQTLNAAAYISSLYVPRLWIKLQRKALSSLMALDQHMPLPL